MKSIKKSDRIFLECEDHTVSGEKFELLWNEKKNILITSPHPSAQELPGYYESEDYISHTDASQTFLDKLYQGVKNHMLSKKVKLITKISSEEKSVLDLGAGTGDFLIRARKKGWKVEGVEPNLKAREQAAEKGLKLLNEVEGISLKYGIISMWHVLEHVTNLATQFQTFHKLLHDRGKLVIAVPNFKSYDASYYKEFWAAYDVPRHLWHFSPEGIKELFKANGFQLEETLPLKFDAYYVSMLSEKYKCGKINYARAFQIGQRSNRKARKHGNYSSLIYIFGKD